MHLGTVFFSEGDLSLEDKKDKVKMFSLNDEILSKKITELAENLSENQTTLTTSRQLESLKVG